MFPTDTLMEWSSLSVLKRLILGLTLWECEDGEYCGLQLLCYVYAVFGMGCLVNSLRRVVMLNLFERFPLVLFVQKDQQSSCLWLRSVVVQVNFEVIVKLRPTLSTSITNLFTFVRCGTTIVFCFLWHMIKELLTVMVLLKLL